MTENKREIKTEIVNKLLAEQGVSEWHVESRFISKRNSVYLLAAGADITAESIAADVELEQEIDALSGMGLFDTPHHECVSCGECEHQGSKRRAKYVWKQYETGDPAYEAEMLRSLRAGGVNVPELIAEQVEGLLIEHISGESLCEMLQRLEEEDEDGVFAADLLAEWLKGYYAAAGGKCRGDINLRNFICEEGTGQLFSVDFEDVGFCSREYDAAAVLAYVLNYEPVFTPWKQRWARAGAAVFVARLNIEVQLLQDEYAKALDDLCLRRSVKVPAEMRAFLQSLFEA